jgi:hypothetical protein
VNSHLKVPCLVADMIAGADSIDDMGAPRGALLYRPRSGRGLEEVSAGLLSRAAAIPRERPPIGTPTSA